MDTNNKEHWENVYRTKTSAQVSWTQNVPQTSLNFIESYGIGKSEKIIDIGGGDSNLVDHLLLAGYKNISVLDISKSAITRAQQRLASDAKSIEWIVSDILKFKPITKYQIWHDRATFHFLTKENQIKKYVAMTNEYAAKFLTIGSFSDNGPKKCSGLNIAQYDEESLSKIFSDHFELISSMREVHTTPFDTQQEFLFCSFRHKSYSSSSNL